MINNKQGFIDRFVAAMILILLLIIGGVFYILKRVYDLNREQDSVPSTHTACLQNLIGNV